MAGPLALDHSATWVQQWAGPTRRADGITSDARTRGPSAFSEFHSHTKLERKFELIDFPVSG